MAESEKQKTTKKRRGCKPGTTNNPHGRPPLERSGSTAIYKLSEEMKYRGEDGKERSGREMIFRRIIDKAVEGDQAFVKIYLERTEGAVKQDIGLTTDGTMQIIFNDNLEGV